MKDFLAELSLSDLEVLRQVANQNVEDIDDMIDSQRIGTTSRRLLSERKKYEDYYTVITEEINKRLNSLNLKMNRKIKKK